MNENRTIAETKWFYGPDGTITMRFYNGVTDAISYRTYKTKSAAKGAETRFHNRMSRIYNQKRCNIRT